MATPLAIQFVIEIGDPVKAAAYQAQYPNGIQVAPATAAALYSAPIVASGGALPATPYILIPYPGFPEANESAYWSQASGTLPAGEGVDAFGNPYPQIPFYWVGFFLCALATPVPSPVPPPIGVRRFICGFEMPTNGETQTQTDRRYSRDASRSVEGLGYAFRSDSNNLGPTISLPTTPNFSYERFYVRLRTLPSGGNDMIWSCEGSVEGSGPSLHVDVTPSGTLVLYNEGNGGAPGTLLITSSALALNTWYRVDLNFVYATAAPSDGSVQMWLNGVSIGNVAVANGGVGLGHVQNQNSSTLSNTTATSHALECDLDDWVNSSYLDVTTGSHIALVRATGFDPTSSAAWVGDWRQLLPLPPQNASTADAVVSSTGNAVLAVTTDYQDTQLGCAAFLVGFNNGSAGSVTAKLGWSIGGSQSVQNVSVTNAVWNTALYTVGGSVIPAIPSLSLVFIKDAAGGAIDANGLVACAESLGFFGPEDVPPGSTVVVPSPTRYGIHNAPYPKTAAAVGAFAPLSPVQVWSGVYTGNNLGQDVITQFPSHWWFVRPLTGDTAGAWWWSSMVSAHGRLQEIMTPIRMPQALLDASNVGRMRVAGQDNQANATGVSYQWIAVSDPGMRFILNGAFLHASSVSSAVNPLINSSFTPEALFLAIEQSSGSTTGQYFKGLGHATADASPLDASVKNNVITIGAGSLTSQPNAVSASTNSPQTAFSAWRRSDDAPIGNCNGQGSILFDLVTYTGDGTGTRSITCNLGNRSPLFAIVTPHNGTSYFRDPSHTGTTSSQTGGTVNSATAIVGGDLNIVKVGSALNSNGIVYDIFVIAGLQNSGGWSPNPSAPFAPVCPLPPGGPGPYPPAPPVNPTPLPPIPPIPTPLPPRGGCYPFTQAKIDLANRLQDPGNVHWTDAENGTYIVEALRTFQAYTQKYRQQGSFATTILAPFYDIPTVLPSLRGYNVKDQDLVKALEYTLMEPPTPTVWTGTSMFTLNDVTQALQRRLDQFLQETGAVLTRQILAVTPASNGRIVLPQNLITIRRLAWIMNDANYTVVPLHREDEWSFTNYQPGWTANPADPSQTWPTGYSVGVTPPLTVQLAPVPLAAGWLDILAVTLGNAMNPAVGVLMGIPDDWTWVVKFGALADLFGQDGTAYDPQRAMYCQARWKLGLEMATQASVALAGRLINVPTRLYALQDADAYRRTWQTGSGAPNAILTTAQNILAVTPPPDENGPGGSYAITLDVVANIPIPVAGTDCINIGIGDEDIDPVLDYAQHLALTKEGPSQLEAAMALYESFAAATGTTKKLDQALVPSRGPLLQQTVEDVRVVPRETPPVETTS